MRALLESISLDEVAGLRPRAWICVGPGYGREDFKASLLGAGRGFISDAVTTPQEFAARIVQTSTGAGEVRLSDPLMRQEVLRQLFSVRQIAQKLPELKKLKRQNSFFKRLDAAIQAGRLSFADDDECSVYHERLLERFGPNPTREEIRLLAAAYEAWLGGTSFWDPPRLLRFARDRLTEDGWPKIVHIPHKIYIFSLQEPESLERSFWEAVGRFTEIVRIRSAEGPEERERERDPPRWNWERWHTIDDACERLGESLSAQANAEAFSGNSAILFAESGTTRRSLHRALKEWGVPEADPRDPTRLRWDEEIKWALLPLNVVARDYERARVVSFVSQWGIPGGEAAVSFSNEMILRGIRKGLKSYDSRSLAPVHGVLAELETKFGGRKKIHEIAEQHLKLLFESSRGSAFVVSFFEGVWKRFVEDYQSLGWDQRRAPLLYWIERLQARIEQSPAPVERVKARDGARVYRLQQAPLVTARKLYLVGVPSTWLSAEGVGDYWWSERDREVLSAEFAVRSGVQVKQERLAALRAWIQGAEEVVVLDAQYDADGRERESILPVLRELHEGTGSFPELFEEHGAHRRWLSGYSPFRPLPAQRVQLGPNPKSEISATTLDHYSRCSFQALAMDRWKVRDAREPDCELWPDVRGNILHEAVKILIQSRDENGNFSCTTREALDRAWFAKPPMGLLRSETVQNYQRSRMLAVLDLFCEKEREYFKRSQARVVSLDDRRLRFEAEGVTIVGTPDRIDETADGLFLMDYKSSGGLPNGTQMLEEGYRLQLPFYALAARGEFAKPITGVQFIELTDTGGRGSGVFFTRYNGKEPGKLTQLRSNSKSLLALEPDDVWSRFQDWVSARARSYQQGLFEAKPNHPEPAKECSRCAVSDLCGYRRRVNDGLEGGGDE